MCKVPLLGKFEGEEPREPILYSFGHIRKPGLSGLRRPVANISKDPHSEGPQYIRNPTALILSIG